MACTSRIRTSEAFLEGTFSRHIALEHRNAYLGGSNEDLSVLRGTQVVSHPHQVQGLSSGFLCLGDMQIHLIAIKVCIIRRADTFVEAQCPATKHFFIAIFTFVGVFLDSCLFVRPTISRGEEQESRDKRQAIGLSDSLL